MNTELTTAALSAEDIQAMKMADTVTFHVHKGKASIRARLDNILGERIFTAKQQRLFPPEDYGTSRLREIPVEGWTLTSYDKEHPTSRYNYDETLRPKVKAYASTSVKYNHRWLTVADMLRVGDILRLHFTADNGTENTRSVNFARDTFDLLVERPGRKQAYPMTFRLDDQCGPRNTARMVQADY